MVDEGGNAVDAAIAAALVSMTTEPGMCSLGGGGFLAIWPPEGEPVVVDGFDAVPGVGDRRPSDPSSRTVRLAYGGGVETLVGHASVATPGVLAACGQAAERFGRMPWRRLVEPAREWAERGFPLSSAAHHYLRYAHEDIFGWHPDSRAALHDETGELLEEGSTVRVRRLADTLGMIAERGWQDLYQGETAAALVGEMEAGGGLINADDLARYEVRWRSPLLVRLGDWELATNPPPALGGLALRATLVDWGRDHSWDRSGVARLASILHLVARARQGLPLDDASPTLEALASFAAGRESSSTVHTSAVDSEGWACSLTVSAGYGSGVMAAGIWMNNTLGELEINPSGTTSRVAGRRLSSNMAPTVGKAGSATLAIGSPGAARITSAIAETLVNFIALDMTLGDAVAHPRLHVDLVDGERPRASYEEGLDLSDVMMERRPFPALSMYFGGVQATVWDGTARVAADPRRAGATAVVERPSDQLRGS